RASVEHAASGIADVTDLERALVRVFRHRVQRRIRGHATSDGWFAVGEAGAARPRENAGCGRAPGLLQVVPQLARTAWVAELAERLRLDLADPFAGDVALLAHLLERPSAPVPLPEPELKHAALTAGKGVQHGRHLLPEELL